MKVGVISDTHGLLRPEERNRSSTVSNRTSRMSNRSASPSRSAPKAGDTPCFFRLSASLSGSKSIRTRGLYGNAV